MFRLGLILLSIAALIPLFVGGTLYLQLFLVDEALPSSLSLVAYTNLMANGVLLYFLCVFGVREKHKWAWWLLVFAYVWIGGNDSVAMLFLNKAASFPIAVIPTVLGFIGLTLTKKELFKAS